MGWCGTGAVRNTSGWRLDYSGRGREQVCSVGGRDEVVPVRVWVCQRENGVIEAASVHCAVRAGRDSLRPAINASDSAQPAL